MVSRVFVRTVLVGIMATMVYLLNLTWMAHYRVIAQKVILMIIESGVLLAALSLLIESLRSFGTITVNRNSPWFVLSGAVVMLDIFEGKNTSHSRTCALFWARSFVLAFVFLGAAAVLLVLYRGIIELGQFLSNPYVPVVLWGEVGAAIGLFFIVASTMLLLFWIAILLHRKLENVQSFIRYAIMVVYICIVGGTFLGVVSFYLDPSASNDLNLSTMIMMGIGAVMAVVSLFGGMTVVGYGLYKLVGTAITRFPVLANVWNTLCPVQRINIVG